MLRSILTALLLALLLTGCTDNCEDVSCFNNGFCNDGTCECPPGYSGEQCKAISLLHLHSIGSAGTSTGQFQWDINNSHWGMAWDGTYLCVADNQNHRIQRFDANGNFVDWIGIQGGRMKFYTDNSMAENTFTPSQIHIDNLGTWYIAAVYHGDSSILVVNTAGDVLDTLAIPIALNATFTTSSVGNVFVYKENHIKWFGPNGIMVTTFGGFGSGDGEFNNSIHPQAMFIGVSNHLFVMDVGNHRIQEFDGSATYLRSIPIEFTSDRGYMYYDEAAERISMVDESDASTMFAEYSTAGVKLNSWQLPGAPFFGYKQSQHILIGGKLFYQDYLKPQIVYYGMPDRP